MQSIEKITLGELMNIKHDVKMSVNKEFGFDVTILQDVEKVTNMHHEKGKHPLALDAIASFCQRYLSAYHTALSKRW